MKRVYKCYKCGSFNVKNGVCINCGKLNKWKLYKENYIHVDNIQKGIKAKYRGILHKYYEDNDGCIWELRFVPRTHKQRRRYVANQETFYKRIMCKKVR